MQTPFKDWEPTDPSGSPVLPPLPSWGHPATLWGDPKGLSLVGTYSVPCQCCFCREQPGYASTRQQTTITALALHRPSGGSSTEGASPLPTAWPAEGKAAAGLRGGEAPGEHCAQAAVSILGVPGAAWGLLQTSTHQAGLPNSLCGRVGHTPHSWPRGQISHQGPNLCRWDTQSPHTCVLCLAR